MGLLNAIKEPLTEMDQRLFLIGSALPGALVFVTLLCVGLARRKKDVAWPAWLSPALFGVAFLFAYFSVHAINSVQVWPADGAKRILHGVALMAIVGALSEVFPKRARVAGPPLLIVACAGAIALPLAPLIRIQGGGAFALTTALWTLACVVVAFSLGQSHARRPGWRVPLLAVAAPFSASLVAYYGSVATLGQMAGGITAVVSATAAAAIIIRRAALRPSAWLTLMTPIVIVLAGARAYAYNPGPLWASALALASPLPALLCAPAKLRDGKWKYGVLAVQILLTATLALGAIWIAYQGRSTYEY